MIDLVNLNQFILWQKQWMSQIKTIIINNRNYSLTLTKM